MMKWLVNISADPGQPLWVDPKEVIAVGGAVGIADEFRRAWVWLRSCPAAMPVPMTDSEHVTDELRKAWEAMDDIEALERRPAR